MAEINPLLMNQAEFEESEKQRKQNEKAPQTPRRFQYVKGSTKIKQGVSIKQYNKALQRYKKEQYKILAKKAAFRKQIKQRVKRTGRGIYRIGRAIPRQRYSEAGRANLISNLRRNIPAEQGNILNVPSPYLQKTDKRKKYSLI